MPFIGAIALQAEDPEIIRARCEAAEIDLLPADDGTTRISPSAAGGAALIVCDERTVWPPSPSA